MKVFLDDVRIPEDCSKYMYARLGALNTLYLENWFVVRNYDEFCLFIRHNYKDITHISFDHDLGEDLVEERLERGMSKRQAKAKKKLERTGLDCARWLVDFYKKKEQPLPTIFIHSMNPVGTENIFNALKYESRNL